MLRVSSGFQILENNKSTRPAASCFHQFSRVSNPDETLALVFEILHKILGIKARAKEEKKGEDPVRVPFDQKFRFEFQKFSYVKWNGIFHLA